MAGEEIREFRWNHFMQVPITVSGSLNLILKVIASHQRVLNR